MSCMEAYTCNIWRSTKYDIGKDKSNYSTKKTILYGCQATIEDFRTPDSMGENPSQRRLKICGF